MSDPLAPGPSPTTAAQDIRGLIGGFLMVLGILWLLLCGTCTLLFTFLNASDGSAVFSCLVVGLGGAIPGLIMFFVGRLLRRP